MSELQSSRARSIGLGGAALWFTIAPTFFITWALIAIGIQDMTIAVLVVAGIIALALGAASISLIHAAMRLPHDNSAQAIATQKVLMRRFGMIVASEIVGFILTSIVCGLLNRYEYIPPLDVIIFGVHLIPLAALFDMRIYYATGVLASVVAIITMLVVPSNAMIGQALSWLVIPSIGTTIVVWLTTIVILITVRNMLQAGSSRADA